MEYVTTTPEGAAEEQAPVTAKKPTAKKKAVKKADAGGAGFCVGGTKVNPRLCRG